ADPPPVAAAAIVAEGGPGPGVYATSVNSGNFAVNAVGTNGATGVNATSDSGLGVYAQSTSGIGVRAVSGGATAATTPPVAKAAILAEGGPDGDGVYATSGNTLGSAVYAVGTDGAAGVFASSDSGFGASGRSDTGVGVYGHSRSSDGVYAESVNGIGVHAIGGGATAAVLGSPAAIFAEGGPGPGVVATSGDSGSAAVNAVG